MSAEPSALNESAPDTAVILNVPGMETISAGTLCPLTLVREYAGE